jgi:ADP-ribose diphosphatase
LVDPLTQSLSLDDVDLLQSKKVYEGYARVKEYTLRHRHYDGTWSQPMTRELFKSGDAVVVLPYDPANDTIILIEQFRISAYDRGITPWLVECIAGRIDKQESPEEVAIRETKEEAGCEITNLIKIGEMFASPGIFAEYISVFCAQTDSSSVQGIHGLDDEQEDIRAIVLDFSTAMEAMESGRFVTAPIFLCLNWLARNRDMLKEKWIRAKD